jgi:hypothetical protein
MIEKIFLLFVIALMIFLVRSNQNNYENVQRQYFYCNPYELYEPPLPLLTKYQFEKIQRTITDFSQKYSCEEKYYTPQNYHLMRKAIK